MEFISKIATATRLAVTGDWSLVGRQVRVNLAQWRVRLHRGNAFVYRDLGFPAVCHPDWADSLGQFSGLAGDHWEMSLMRRWLKRGDAVFDIGASLGLYAFAAGDVVGPAGTVLAVDADPYIVEKLGIASNLLKWPQLRALHAAVSDRSGPVDFYVQSNRRMTNEQSMRPSEQQIGSAIRLVSPALTMKDLTREYTDARVLTMIKVDIEGAEALAFKAVPEELLRANGPFWIVEIHPGALRRFGAAPRDITSCFPVEDFETFLVAKHPIDPTTAIRMLRPLVSTETFADSIYYNMLAVPRGSRWIDRRASIRHLLSQ